MGPSGSLLSASPGREIAIALDALHQGQQAVVDGAGRYNVLACGRRWGKTLLGIDRLFDGDKGILDSGGYASGWFAPSSRYVDDVWDEILARFGGLITYKNRQSGRLRFMTGGTLDFWAMGEDKEVARGRRYARVIIDEAAHIRYFEEAWNRAVEPTLTDHRGEAWFISTPNGLNYFHELWKRGGDPAYPGWRSWSQPTRNNPHIQPEEIETKRATIPHLVFLQEYEARFITFGGGLVKPEHLREGRPEPGASVGVGVDLAISAKEGADYTALVAMSEGPRGICIHEADRGRWSFHEAQRRIIDFAERHKAKAVVVESNQYQAAAVQELVRTTRLPVFGVRPDRDKVTRFLPLLARFEQGRVTLSGAIPGWFREELLAFPQGEHDDAVDAAVYAFMALARVNTGPLAFNVKGL